MHFAIGCALASAALFGASTPLAKLLVCALPPLPLAGLLYLGSGIGLLGWWRLRRHRGQELREAALTRCDALWLAGGRSSQAALSGRCC